jgi:hypothetical protein
VDNKIKRSLARAENPISGNAAAFDANTVLKTNYDDGRGVKPRGGGNTDMNQVQKDHLIKKIHNLEQKINVYINHAQE